MPDCQSAHCKLNGCAFPQDCPENRSPVVEPEATTADFAGFPPPPLNFLAADQAARFFIEHGAPESCEKDADILARAYLALRSLPREGEAAVAWVPELEGSLLMQYAKRDRAEVEGYVAWRRSADCDPIVRQEGMTVVPLYASPLPAPETGRHHPTTPTMVDTLWSALARVPMREKVSIEAFRALVEKWQHLYELLAHSAAPPLPAGRPEEAKRRDVSENVVATLRVGVDEEITEVVVTRTEVVLLGNPFTDDPAHNCDANGCGQSHVLARHTLAALPAGRGSEQDSARLEWLGRQHWSGGAQGIEWIRAECDRRMADAARSGSRP